jgi:predicted  nucleic acid-binding Zn-ribbon protein
VEIDFEKLIRLQALDLDIREAQTLLDSIPSQIDAIDQKIASGSQAVAQAKDKLAANQKKRRELEGEVKDIKSRITKHKSQQSQVKSNKEYGALLKEIEDDQGRIDELEETIIQEMLQADDIEAEIRAANDQQGREKKVLEAEKGVLLQKKAEAEARVQALNKDKEALLPEIAPDELALYQRIFRKKGGIALSSIRDDFCSLCHMRVRPQMLNELLEKNKLITCENCGRILYRRPDSDKAAPEKAAAAPKS